MPMAVTYCTCNGVLLGEIRGGVETIYVPDTLGNIIEHRDASGNKTYEATYWPYGEVRTESGTNPSPFGFVGLLGYFRDFAKLLYVRARHLRVDLTRWMTVDPLWPEESAHGYVSSLPTINTDPTGMGCTGAGYTWCAGRCAAYGGIRSCAQNKSGKVVHCGCKRPRPNPKPPLWPKLLKLLKQLNVLTWICSAPCIVAFVDCIYDLYKSSGDLRDSACKCHKGYKEAGDSGNLLQDVLFDLSCARVMTAMKAICDGVIDLGVVEFPVPKLSYQQ